IRDYINHNDCQSEKRMDLTFYSVTKTYISRNLNETDPLNCCQATRSSNRTVNLGCVNGHIVTHTYIHVEECSCSKANCHRAGAGHTLAEDSQRKRSFGRP
uniref:CTCK domain-containing protein n=1 Tax=Sinocyclocheilus anshuiensis TaxID=1608454 RepID=A0A671PPY4_9TELE